MKNDRPGLAALATAAFLLAVTPAVAATAICTAKDSAGKTWRWTETGLLEFSVKAVASAIAKADCQDKSRHPATCKVVGCKVTK